MTNGILEPSDLDSLPVKPGERITWTTRRGVGVITAADPETIETVEVEGVVDSVEIFRRKGRDDEFTLNIWAKPDDAPGTELVFLSDLKDA